MRARFQFSDYGRGRSAVLRRSALVLSALVVILAGAAASRADDTPANAVGRVRGTDISVEGGIGAGGGTTVAPEIYVSNGNVVTVHSGKARMTLFAGGKVDICGPAKFTILVSGNAITLALNFGRVRADLPAKTSLRIFTPAIVGTPIDINGGSRDVTVGLNLDDSLCVLATSGAIQLEHQFTGEKIIVPQAGEFFLNSGKLLPIAGTPGTCQCFADEPDQNTAPVIPEFATTAPAAAPPDSVGTTPASRTDQSAASELDATPGIQYSVLLHANEGHPLAASARMENPPSVPTAFIPADGIVAPVLSFTAGAPLPPPGTPPDMILLLREARVSPEWQFSGHVDAPEFATAMQHALGEVPRAPQQNSGSAQPTSHDKEKKKKGGFWAALKRAFGGS